MAAVLTFFFDPLCPFTWRASQWLREVRRQQPLDVQWRFFSLAEAHGSPNELMRAPLRMAALARREGGNDAVDRVYLALGTAIHERGVDARDQAALEQAFERALQEGDLDRDLLQRALADPSTWEDVLADHDEARERYGAYGVPWLVLGEQTFGFNGPIMSEVPRGETAVELWRHLSWTLAQPYFYELKRER
ncbi:MAG TPA: DsbA family protein [Chloroflexota bacterium]|jgi:predicted DsbA family dithiol-disulfide isomerase|nr:DsbA family protein [Chloroflexota bacterium]